MATIRRINVSQVDGNNSNVDNEDEIRPFGEAGFFIDDQGASDRIELLMFDGIRTHFRSKVLSKGIFYGGDADSGDGNGYDTIKLIPDVGLHNIGTDQYIIIDPTDPNHIHIRAGGAIDNSTADLILGGEKNSVIVSDSSDSVVITSDAGEGSTNSWVFTNTGSLLFPDDTGQTTAWNPANVDWAAIVGPTIQTNGLPVGTRFTQPVPTTSEGSLGDTIGSVAFDENYIYYCTANYVVNTFTTTIASPGISLNTIPVAKGSYGTPTTDWTVTVSSIEFTITEVTDGGNSWILTVDNPSITGGTGIAATLFNGIEAADIWKRIAWSNDTW